MAAAVSGASSGSTAGAGGVPPGVVAPVLELAGVRYTYPGAVGPVLDGIDLELDPGRVVAIVGANGAGLSTLCLLAAGLAPSIAGGHLEGVARLAGNDVRTLRPHEAASRAGLLVATPATQLSGTASTAWEEIAFGPRNLGLGVAEIVDRVDGAIATLAIERLAARDPARLSGGEAQLVALASVLALRPSLLVLDEPTARLDPAGARLVADSIARLAATQGTAVIVAEHRERLVRSMADTIVRLEGGRIVGGVGSRLEDQMVPPIGRRSGAPAAGPAIDLRAVSYTYHDGTVALRQVSLGVARGERVALVGANGSGKTTLARLLVGLLRPTIGSVHVLGTPIAGRHVAALASLVGLAFQDPDHGIFASTVEGEVRFGPRNLGRTGDDLDAAVAAALDATGLDGDRRAHPYDLGWAGRKRLGIASVLSMGTPVVVLDEPTTGQDTRGTERVAGLVVDLAASGRTVLAITHDLAFAAAAFDRIVVLGAGAVVLDGPPDAVLTAGHATALRDAGLEVPAGR